jgi:hypothetical protein
MTQDPRRQWHCPKQGQKGDPDSPGHSPVTVTEDDEAVERGASAKTPQEFQHGDRQQMS